MHNKIFKALHFATIQHAKQKRKCTGVPYVTHPIRVADILMNYNQNVDVVVAGILHDTAEDTDTTTKIIQQKFGKRVADLVKQVTNRPEEMSDIGKANYIGHKMRDMMDDEAFIIKLADRLDNVSLNGANKEQIKKNKSFIEKYREETRDILGWIEERVIKMDNTVVWSLYKNIEDAINAS